jgi:hypothetical protein
MIGSGWCHTVAAAARYPTRSPALERPGGEIRRRQTRCGRHRRFVRQLRDSRVRAHTTSRPRQRDSDASSAESRSRPANVSSGRLISTLFMGLAYLAGREAQLKPQAPSAPSMAVSLALFWLREPSGDFPPRLFRILRMFSSSDWSSFGQAFGSDCQNHARTLSC